jgi:hypothetical protein
MRRSTTSCVYCTETLTCPALACIGLGLDGGEDAMQNLAGRGRRESWGQRQGGVMPARVEGEQTSSGVAGVLCAHLEIKSCHLVGLALPPAPPTYQLARYRPVAKHPSLSQQKSPVGCHAGSMA